MTEKNKFGKVLGKIMPIFLIAIFPGLVWFQELGSKPNPRPVLPLRCEPPPTEVKMT